MKIIIPSSENEDIVQKIKNPFLLYMWSSYGFEEGWWNGSRCWQRIKKHEESNLDMGVRQGCRLTQVLLALAGEKLAVKLTNSWIYRNKTIWLWYHLFYLEFQ